MQDLIVALLVVGCSIYATWKLMPGAARRTLATALLRLPLPAPLAGPLRKATLAPTGCGCDGCDHAPAKSTPQAQVITFHPRPRR